MQPTQEPSLSAPHLWTDVGGAALRTEATATTSVNPAQLDDIVAVAHLAGPEAMLRACQDAKERAPAWAGLPAPLRGQVIANLGLLVTRNKSALADLIVREMGKTRVEALGEVQEIIDTCAYFASEGRRLYGQTVPSEMRDKQLLTFRRPLGVVAVITAANFPAAVPSWYIVPALVAGNTVVWKPSELVPMISKALLTLLHKAGVPAGVVNLVLADGPSTFTGLTRALEQGLVDQVGFTGSTTVGTMISELCGRHRQSPCLELGGKNPMVVMPDADLDRAVEGALFSGFATGGQRCTSLGTLIVHESVHGEVLHRLDAALRAAPIGDPHGEVLYGPLIDERYLSGYLDWLDTVKSHHALYGSDGVGRIESSNPRKGFVGDPDRGVFAHPVIVDGVAPDDEIYREETFGPLIGVATFSTFDEAVQLANGHRYGLSAAVYTSDPGTAFRFAEQVGCGMLSVNNSTVGAEAHLPFGGNGRSGNGSRQSGFWMLDQVTRWQSVNWDYGSGLRRAQIDVEVPEAELDFTLVDTEGQQA
ncbi:aldehyde dehydrogenase family protein [Streptomyces sp. NPDC048581]|uniref:aldehyde dehydrogenase family protein n=1 Tax=unclassified Streptomyces TaxID=2593676 RepID=UPI00372263E3